MQSKINLIAHHYGLHSRLDKAAEECLELALALMHHKERGGEIDHITEEIADVEIMLEQIKILLEIGQFAVDMQKEIKVKRQMRRMREEE